MYLFRSYVASLILKKLQVWRTWDEQISLVIYSRIACLVDYFCCFFVYVGCLAFKFGLMRSVVVGDRFWPGLQPRVLVFQAFRGV